ncbi:MAG: hypothetical protein KF774_15760 [Planctomyces sp.]|nr:hypothetical protein [Planctomyces sp.]
MRVPSPHGMTLRQKLIEADKLARELMDHLERGFAPRIHGLRRITRQGSEGEHEDVTDVTVRSTVDRVLESDDFSHGLCVALGQFLQSIEAETRDITT